MRHILLSFSVLFLISCSGSDDKKSAGNITQGEKNAINKIAESSAILDDSVASASNDWDDGSSLVPKARYVYDQIKETCVITNDQKSPKEGIYVSDVQFSGDNCVLPYKSLTKSEGGLENYSYSSEKTLSVLEKQIQDYTGVTEASGSELGEMLMVDNNDPNFTKRFIADDYLVMSLRTLTGDTGMLEYDIQSQMIFNEETAEGKLVQLKSRILMNYPPHSFLIYISLDSSGLTCTLNGRPVQCTDFLDIQALSPIQKATYLNLQHRLKKVFRIL